ncbi:MAG: M13 family metallopeptidase [Myxococcaceae bacterium]
MHLRPLAVAVLALELACASNEPRPTPAAAAPATDAGVSSARAMESPDAGRHGIDVGGMDPAIAPGTDFFLYANGTWLRDTEIPADQAGWGTFNILAQKSLVRTRAVLEAAAGGSAVAGSDERKAGDLYASFMDEAGVEATGIEPLRPQLAAVGGLRDKTALARALGQQLRADVDPLNRAVYHTDRLFGLWVAPDMAKPSVYVGYLMQGGLGMPDREYYLAESPRMAGIRDRYRAHLAKVFALAGIAGGEDRAKAIVDLETRMARVHATRAESFEVRQAYNPWKRVEFGKRAPGLDWTAFFDGAGLQRQPMVVVWQPKAITGLAALVKQVPLATWKDWMTFHLLDRASPYLPRAFVDERFEFHGKTLSGAPQLAECWKRGTFATSELLGDAVGKLYVARHFPPSAKAQVEALVTNIRAAFDRRIGALDWMDPKTKEEAREKVRTLYVGIGYPEHWEDISGLEIRRDDLLGNVHRVSVFEYQQKLGRLGKPVDKTEWCMSPQTVNAVNLPLQNGLNFPAAILEPPFFDPAAPPVSNYGAIGSVIGHEISHSFDDQGAMFDAQGRLRNWWTPADFARFEEAGARLIKQYDAYQPFPDLHVNGKLTLSENIADVAGIAAAHDGWTTSLQGAEPPAFSGFSGEQQFFIAYAQNWRGKLREAMARQRIITDGHAPGHYRALTVRNIDSWYTAFGVQPGQALYLTPEQRVRVW